MAHSFFGELYDPKEILQAVQGRISLHCRKEDASKLRPVLTGACAYNVVLNGLQRLTQLYPHQAGEFGLASIDKEHHSESDHESNVIMNLGSLCPTETGPAHRLGHFELTGKAACAYAILQRFVRQTGTKPPAPGPAAQTFHAGAANGDTVDGVSVLCLVALLVILALVYNKWPHILKKPWFWFVMLLLVVGVLHNSWPGQVMQTQVEQGTPTSSGSASTGDILEEKFYREHTDPVRAKAMTSVMFDLTPEQKYGSAYNRSGPTPQTLQRPEQFYREDADRVHAKALHKLFDFQQRNN